MKFTLTQPDAREGVQIPDSRFEMPALFTPGRKPVGPVVINYENPITRDLEACWVPVVGNELRDLTGKYITTTGASNYVSKANYIEFDGTGNGMEYDLRPDAAGDRTLVLRTRTTAAAEPSGTVLGARHGSSPYDAFLLNVNGYINNVGAWVPSNSRFSAWSYGTPANYPYTFSTANIIDGGWHTLIAVFTHGAKIDLYADGAKVNGTQYSGSNYDQARGYHASQHTEIGGMPDLAAAQYLGDIESAYIFTRALSDAEAISLSADPYQFLIPA